MGCICKCHEKLDKIGVNGCCYGCESEHDPLRNAEAKLRELSAVKRVVDKLKRALRGAAGAISHDCDTGSKRDCPACSCEKALKETE